MFAGVLYLVCLCLSVMYLIMLLSNVPQWLSVYECRVCVHIIYVSMDSCVICVCWCGFLPFIFLYCVCWCWWVCLGHWMLCCNKYKWVVFLSNSQWECVCLGYCYGFYVCYCDDDKLCSVCYLLQLL